MKRPIYYPINNNIAVHYADHRLLTEIYNDTVKSSKDILSHFGIDPSDCVFHSQIEEDQGGFDLVLDTTVYFRTPNIVFHFYSEAEDQSYFEDGDHFVICYSWNDAMNKFKDEKMKDFVSDDLIKFIAEKHKKESSEIE